MDTPVLYSTFFLTLLLLVGLFFFIRASVKDRTQQIQLVSEESEDLLLSQLREYFNQRAYRVMSVDPEQNQVTLQGFIRPSWFLAIFLSFLAATGLLCLALVLSQLYPSLTNFLPFLTLLAPAAGVFYWQKAGRVEQVLLKVETPNTDTTEGKSLLTVKAHRDELRQLQEQLPLKLC